MIAVATPITACCIRLANLMNSEIIGKPSDVPWAFIFERVDMQPRHPGQLYEAIAYLILFFIMIYLYKNYSKKLHRGFFFGLCLTYIFVFRFFIEFLKENQEDFENNMTSENVLYTICKHVNNPLFSPDYLLYIIQLVQRFNRSEIIYIQI